MEAESEALTVAPAQAANWLEHVANDTRRLVQSLPSYTDEELLVCRQSAEVLNEASWIVICATDHEIMKRAQPVRDRYKGDLTKSGIYATAIRQAKATGLDATTIIRNATIFKNFGHLLTNKEDPDALRLVELLPEKGYWEAATRAGDGQMRETLDYFADQKSQDPRFTVRAAHRYVTQQKAPPLTMALPSIEENSAAAVAFEYVKQGFTLLSNATGGRLRSILKGFEEEIEYELQLPPCTVMERISMLINEGWDEIDAVSSRAGWPREWVVAWFRRMADLDWVRPFDKGRVEGARGASRQGWTLTPLFYKELERIKGQPLETVELTPQDWRMLKID
jgi:hypothetical protein